MMNTSSTSRQVVFTAGLAVTLALAGSALARPSLGALTVGNGRTSGTHIVSAQEGQGPGLVTVTALSPQVSKEGSVANVKLLNDRTLVGVTSSKSSGANGISVTNPTGQPVLSSGFLSGMTGGVGSN